MAEEMFEDYDSSLPAFAFLGGERGAGLLESALALPRQTFDGKPLYRSVFDKAAVLMRSIIKNHPFIDGNKRMGVSTAALFLLMNGRLLFLPPSQLVEYALQIAAPDSPLDWPEISRWLRVRCPYVQDVSRLGRPGEWEVTSAIPEMLKKLEDPTLASRLRETYEGFDRHDK
jgi:death-on-curing protein